MSKKTVLVVNDIMDCGASYYRPFEMFGRYETDIDILKKRPRDVSLVVFTGGSDVDPDMYGHSKSTQCGSTNFKRDEQEKEIFDMAVALKIPMAGICRGAQFLCAVNGGTLIQHLDNHYKSHKILTHNGRNFVVTSTHHQLANPTYLVEENRAKVLAWAYPRLSDYYHVGQPKRGLIRGLADTINIDVEYEVVYYNKSNSIGFQYHPEIMSEESEGFKYVAEMCEKHLGLKPEE